MIVMLNIKEFETELKEHIIPFWRGLRDEDFGGYFGLVDFNLTIHKKAVKGVILNSRILWFFSEASLIFKDDSALRESLLSEARHAYVFLRDHCVDHVNGGVYWSVTYDGKPEDTIKHTYNQAFSIYALSAYFKATGDSDALKLAFELFVTIDDICLDKNGYLEAFTEDFKPAGNDKLSENGVLADRTMNTALHVLEAYTAFYDVSQSILVKERIRELLTLFADKIYDPKNKRLNVFFDNDYKSLIDLQSYGHDIESSWLIDEAIDVLPEGFLEKEEYERLRNMTESLAESTYERAFNGESFKNECEAGVVNEHRVWWVQAEAIVGFTNAYGKTGDGRFLEAATALWEFTKAHVIDKRPGGEWYWEVKETGEPYEREIVEPWKCPYHNGRMCMEMIKRLSIQEKK